jgi:hypothetical protein
MRLRCCLCVCVNFFCFLFGPCDIQAKHAIISSHIFLFNFELLTALTILWDMLPCSLVEVHRHSPNCHLAGY